MLKPKLFTTLRGYSKKQFTSDLTAGIIVGIVALPLAIAFGIASGVTPDKGLITAIIAGFIISFLGGSKVQIGGPTGAFIVIVYGIVQQYGVNGLILATLMAGVILVIMGIARLGSIIKFIPHPVIVGFTSAIALIIFSSQVKDLLGLNVETVPAEFFEKWIVFSQNLFSINYWSFLIGAVSLIIIIFFPKITHRIPGSIVAIIVATLLVDIFQLPVETIGSRFGDIPSSLPTPTFPDFDFEVIKNLISPATTIALLAAIYCIAAGFHLQPGWHEMIAANPEESSGSGGNYGRRGGIIILAILYWPYVLIGLGGYFGYHNFRTFRDLLGELRRSKVAARSINDSKAVTKSF